jgi:hypothetical protein
MTGDANQIPFVHRQSSHCESGVVSNLLHHHGIDISEAMAFGIGGGLFFGYLPFIKINKLPLTTFRCGVGGILKRTTRYLGVGLKVATFRNTEAAMAALDAKLDQGQVVGCRTGGYWLPYFPPAFRFHFNMHNLVVYGKTGQDYLISDPVFPEPVVCPAGDLSKARFAKGAMAPKGTMYHLNGSRPPGDLSEAVCKGIRHVCHAMLHTPGPLIGVGGIRLLARQMRRWPRKLGARKTRLYTGQVIRMQEELGTGGAGFRFMYAAFLQEAAEILKQPLLRSLAEEMTAAGDRWRDFAVMAARNCKGRADADTESFDAMAGILRECADREEAVYRQLLAATKRL